MERIRALPRPFFVVVALVAIESYADFVISLNLALYVSASLGYSDAEAGYLYSAWAMAASVAGIALGPVIDVLGVRSALLAGATALLVGRVALATAYSNVLVVVALLGFHGIGSALSMSVISIAIRQIVPDERDLSLAYSVSYAAMQAGAIGAGLVTDAFNASLDDGGASVIASTCLTTLVYLVVIVVAVPRPASVTRASVSLAGDVRAVLRDGAFWRLVVFALWLTGARSVWRYIDVILPKFVQRTLGAHAHFGIIYSINPVITMMTVTLAQIATQPYSAYSVIVVGTLVTGVAPLVLYVLTPVSYATLALFMLLMSVGEVLYSPRISDFTLRLAPRGREGMYAALSTAPLFLIRLAVGSVSGVLLETYCAVGHSRNQCGQLWLVVAGIALTTPVLLAANRRWLDSHVLHVGGSDGSSDTAPGGSPEPKH